MNRFFQPFNTAYSRMLRWRSTEFIIGSIMVLSICAGIRLYPDIIHSRNEAKLESKAIVRMQLRKSIAKSLLQKDPTLSDERVSELTDATVTKQINENSPELLASEAKVSKILVKEKLKGNGLPLLGADPYYYLSLTRQLINTGKLWEKRKGRDYFNPMMLAPGGCYYPIDLHPVIGAWFHQTVRLLNKTVPLEKTVRWIPVILSVMTVFTLILLGLSVYRLTTPAVLLGALHLAIAPIYLKRSLIGWYDTDPYNVLFPLIITALLGVIACSTRLSGRNRLMLSVAAGAAILTYSLFWRGWLLACSFLLISSLLCALIQILFKKIRLGSVLICLGTVLAIPLAGSLIFWGKDGILQELDSFKVFTGMMGHKSFPFWPDVFITVGELRSAGWIKASCLSGGIISLLITLTALIFLGVKSIVREKNFNAEAFYMLLVCSGVLFFSVSTERFALLATAPLSIGFMISVQQVPDMMKAVFGRLLTEKGRSAVFPLIIPLSTVILLGSIGETSVHAYRQIYKFRPIYNVSWDRMMRFISEKTEPEAIITAWWSPGHFITSKGMRRVSIDGATQNETRAYWVARLFTESSEPEAVGILRMLNSTGESLQNKMLNYGSELPDIVRTLNRILSFPRSITKQIFDKKFSASESDDLISSAFPDSLPDPSYLFIYKHMMDQIQALEYVGFWDFKKAEIFNNVIREHADKIPAGALKRGSKEYVKLLWSMTKPPTPTPQEGDITAKGASSARYTNGVSVGGSSQTVRIDSDVFGVGIPQWAYYVSGGKLQKQKIDHPTVNAAVIFTGDNLDESSLYTSQKTVIIHPRLADSIAARLYWLKGAGLKFILPVFEEADVTKNTRFVLYKVDWEGYYDFMRNLDKKLTTGVN